MEKNNYDYIIRVDGSSVNSLPKKQICRLVQTESIVRQQNQRG